MVHAHFTGIQEAGWDPGDSSGTGVRLLMNNSILDATPNNLQHFMMMVVRQMQADENFWCFLEPVAAEDVPDYRDVIKVSTHSYTGIYLGPKFSFVCSLYVLTACP